MLGTAPRDAPPARAVPHPPPGILGRLAGRAAGSPLFRRAAGGTAWSLAGSGGARLLALLGAVLVARQVGAEAFGEYSLVLATTGMLQAFTGFGLGETSTRYLAGRYRRDPEAAGRVVALSTFVAAALGGSAALALVLAAPWVAEHALHAPGLAGALRAGAPLLVVGPVGGALLGVLTGLERFRAVAAVSTIAAAASVPLLAGGARLGGPAGAVVATVLAASVATSLYAWSALRAARRAGIVPRWSRALVEWRVLFSFSVPATLSNALLAPVSWATAAMLAAEPGGMHELGLFSAANQWRNAILLLGMAASAALLPLFSDLHDSGRRRALSRAFWIGLGALGALAAAGAAALAGLAPVIVRAYGDGFGAATPVLVVLVAAGALAAPLAVATQVVAGSGRMWLSFGLNLAWALVLVGTAWTLRGRGAMGLSLAHLAAYLLHLAASVTCAALVLRARRRPEVSRAA